MIVLVVAIVLAAAIASMEPRAGRSLSSVGHISVDLSSATSGAPEPVEGRVVAVIAADGRREAVGPGDLIEEPDFIDTYPALDTFFDRQTQLAAALRDGLGVVIETASGNEVFVPIRATHHRLALLPVTFWVQLGVAVAALLIGAWIFALRPRDRSAQLFALAGVGLFVSLIATAIYSSRAVAIPGKLFQILNLGGAGAWLMGAALIGLFLVYPRRLVGPRTIGLVFAGCAVAFLTRVLRIAPTPALSQLPVVIALVALALTISWQWRATARDPAGRAVVRWFGVSVLLGCTAFVALITAPQIMAMSAPIPQGYAVIAFLAIYGGAAIAVARYRLFDLDRWALRILTAVGTGVILIVIDAVLVVVLQVAAAPSLGLALLIVTLGYLPVRDLIWQRLTARRRDRARLFDMVSEVAFALDHRTARWEALLRAAFEPLSILPADAAIDTPEIREDGIELCLPAVAGAASLRLRYLRGGARLFGRDERILAQDIITLLETIDARRRQYDQAVVHERLRIARDLHDDVGARLLSALHGAAPETRSALHAVLDDIRMIVSGLGGEPSTFGALVADLRHEAARRLEILGIVLDWPPGADADAGDRMLEGRVARTTASIVRELISNVLRHADASAVTVRLECRDGAIAGMVADDGVGLSRAGTRMGHGLRNLTARAQALGGSFSLVPAERGVTARFCLPCAPTPEQGVSAPVGQTKATR
ncbi:ATP-binding protein [uncultured Sphingomonas sp.]|uniref:sensor histidine kinase n=1 Tax=uncultured Sphingomonas sp. TaxID=158754 RepID=UPI003748DC5E